MVQSSDFRKLNDTPELKRRESPGGTRNSLVLQIWNAPKM